MIGSIKNKVVTKYEGVDKSYFPLLPAVLLITLFLVLPILYLIYFSFREFEPIVIWGEGYTIEHYQYILFDDFYREMLYYTIRLALYVTILSFIIGYPIGYYTARTTPRRRTLMLFAILLPMMVGTMVRVYGWITILGTDGFINMLLDTLIGQSVSLLGETRAVVIGLTSVFLPFIALPVYSSVEKTSRDLELAARNLGANKFQAFYKITFRMSLSGAVTGSIFVFALTMSSMVIPILLGGRTDNTMGKVLYETAIVDFNWPRAGAIAVLLGVVTLSIIFIYLKLVRDRIEVQS